MLGLPEKHLVYSVTFYKNGKVVYLYFWEVFMLCRQVSIFLEFRIKLFWLTVARIYLRLMRKTNLQFFHSRTFGLHYIDFSRVTSNFP